MYQTNSFQLKVQSRSYKQLNRF